MDWNGRPVLVTGAGGFIGSHLVEELSRRGANVRAFLHYGVMGERGLLDVIDTAVIEAVECISGDLRDIETVMSSVRGREYVFHLGALIGIPYSYQSPRDVVETNVIGTLNVLQACRGADVRRLIQTSTSEVYGSAVTIPMREDHPLQGQSPYAATKIGADHLAESFWRSFGLPVSIVRPFNTYGPRQSSRAIIPTIISQALAGDVLRLGSLEPTRDFNYVTDTVSGFLQVAATDSAAGETFNLGTGRETSVGDLVRIIGELTGTPLVVEEDRQRVRPPSSEVDRLVADATKVQRQCGWRPVVDLEEGLRRTVNWVTEHRALYRPLVYGV